jgi:hypothetical protein
MELEGLIRIKAECIWQETELPTQLDPELRRRLIMLTDDFRTAGVPIAPSITPFERYPAVRPKGHLRSYYLQLPQYGNQASGYIAIKGTEPALTDALKSLGNSKLPLAWTGRNLPIIDYLPIEEHKVPMALTTEEALGEANIACKLHSQYVRRYHELPYLPLPLAVFKWPAETVENIWNVLRPLISPFTEEIVRRLIAGGVSAYIYYYPTPPFPRVRHLAQELRSSGASRLLQLRTRSNIDQTIERWIRLFVRILALGYLPATPSQAKVGHAVQQQNVIIGGGFVDLGSIRPIAEFQSERDFIESYRLSIEEMAHTVTRYLFAQIGGASGMSAPELLSLVYFYDLLSQAIAEDSKMFGDQFDQQLKSLPPFSQNLAGWIELAERFQNMPLEEDLQAILGGGEVFWS